MRRVRSCLSIMPDKRSRSSIVIRESCVWHKFLWRRLLVPAALEYNTRFFQKLSLLLCDLVGVNVELLRQLRDRLVALDGS